MTKQNIMVATGLSLSMIFSMTACDAPSSEASELTDKPAYTSDYEGFDYYGIERPVCYDTQGKKVRWYPASTIDLKSRGALLGISFYDKNDNPGIAYNAELLPIVSPIFQQMVLHHECSHHELGHTLRYEGTVSENERIKIEDQTDCHAFNKLGYGAKEIPVIMAALGTILPLDPELPISVYTKKDKVLESCL